MYPLPAVLVNCSEPGHESVRAALADNAVSIAAEFATADDLLARWPSPPDAIRRLLVVKLRSLEDAKQTGRVESCFPGWPLLALVEGDCDAAGLFQVSRAGAAQLVPYPFQREDVNAALDRLLIQFALRSTPCRVIAVSGASEGCGATSVAVGLATELSAVGQVPCVLTELSFGIGRLAGLLNLSPTTTTRELLSDPVEPNLGTVQAALMRYGPNLGVLSGQVANLEPFAPPAGRLPHLIRLLRQSSAFVVADMPYTFDPHYFEAVSSADEVFLVLRQEVPAVQAAKLLARALAERGLPAPNLIVNQYDPDHPSLTCDALGRMLGVKHVYPIAADAAGHRAAANVGRPLRDLVPTSPAVADERAVAAAVLEAAGIHPHLPRRTLWDRAQTFLTRMTN